MAIMEHLRWLAKIFQSSKNLGQMPIFMSQIKLKKYFQTLFQPSLNPYKIIFLKRKPQAANNLHASFNQNQISGLAIKG